MKAFAKPGDLRLSEKSREFIESFDFISLEKKREIFYFYERKLLPFRDGQSVKSKSFESIVLLIGGIVRADFSSR